MATKFETELCSRCGGGGRYSFNLMDGDRCYGCGGTGIRLSKRGAAARAWFHASLQKPVEAIEAGFLIWQTNGVMGPKRWLKVLDAKESGTIWNGTTRGVDLVIEGCTYSCPNGSVLIAAKDKAEIDGAIEKALIYQAGLTKVGKPSKARKETA